MALIEELIKEKWLKTPQIISAFRIIKRVDFLPDDMKDLAELNEALPIGWGQTISQPLVVAFMLELLQPQKGQKILDVGSGSGWTSALLGCVVGGARFSDGRIIISENPGKVIAIERIKELLEFGKNNVSKYDFTKKGIVKFVLGDGAEGYEKEAPYDRILVSATAKEFFSSWQKQLKVGGRIVFPMDSSLWLYIKKSESEFLSESYPGFVFVPLVH